MDVLKTKDGLANSLNNLNQPAQAAALFQVRSPTRWLNRFFLAASRRDDFEATGFGQCFAAFERPLAERFGSALLDEQAPDAAVGVQEVHNGFAAELGPTHVETLKAKGNLVRQTLRH